MTASTGQRPRGAGRVQLIDTALRLFARDGVEGTSLQAIADEMGVSKAAVYYHYKTKDDLVVGVLAPMVTELHAMIDRVKACRGRNAQLDELVTGIVTLAVEHHERFAVIMGDPLVANLLKEEALTHDWESLNALFDDTGRGPSAKVAISLFVSGLLGPIRDPELADLSREHLKDELIEAGRRLLQIRRRPAS